jgi:hypothetical protein
MPTQLSATLPATAAGGFVGLPSWAPWALGAGLLFLFFAKK